MDTSKPFVYNCQGGGVNIVILYNFIIIFK